MVRSSLAKTRAESETMDRTKDPGHLAFFVNVRCGVGGSCLGVGGDCGEMDAGRCEWSGAACRDAWRGCL